uniref:Uncharacterized protein n=1 Tax=Fagus sylvatica TaxID=28930 RepID=A0A2N9I1A8_FAGSY
MSHRGSGAMRASIEVVVALFVGSECTRIPYFRLSYLLIWSVCLMLLIIWSDDTFSIFDPSGQAFDSFIYILDGGSTSLISGLSSNFSGSRKKLPQCGTTRSMVRPMDKPKIFSGPRKSASVSTSMSAECVYDERFPSNFLEPLNTTHGLVEPRRKNCPSIKVETGAWPSFSYGQRSTKASGFLASGLTGGLEGEMNFIGHGAKWTVPFMRYDLLKDIGKVCGIMIGSQRFSCALPSVGGIPNIRLGNMFSRTIIYLDVAAAGSSIDLLTNTAPLSSPSRSFKSCAPWELVLSEPTLADSKVLFAICSTNAIRAGMSTILFVFTASSILSSTRIKSTRNCNCKPTIRSKYGFFRVSTKILIISFSSRRGHARGRHFSPPLGFGGVGGLGSGSMIDVRTSFRHFTVGTFAIFSLLVSHFCVSLHYHVYEGKKIVKLVLRGGHPNLMFIRLHLFLPPFVRVYG